MLHLRVLGHSEIVRQAGSTVEAVGLAPKRLALLAYLALARPRGFHRRDILMAMFWQDFDEARARNALNQALHSVRVILGREAVQSRGRDEVGLARDTLCCDAVSFEDALDRGDHAHALAEYRGDLLLGLNVPEAPGFERWLDDERTRLRRRARDAAATLAVDARRADDPQAAAQWLERALELVPTDETVLRELVVAHDQMGDRAGALRRYADFAALLRSEFDMEPAPETMALAERVRVNGGRHAVPEPNGLKQRASDRKTSSDRERVDGAAPLSVNPAAYDAWQMGWHKHTTLAPNDLPSAIELYEESARLDPAFAPAHVGMALVQFLLICMGERPADRGAAIMRGAVDKALALDPTGSFARVALGQYQQLTHDWAGAEESFVAAARASPTLAVTHGTLGNYLTGMGRFDEAVESIERARHLDPLALYVNFLSGWCLHYASRNAEAVQRLGHAIDLVPDDPLSWLFLAKSHCELRHQQEAFVACERTRDLIGRNPMSLAYVVNILGRMGDVERASAVMRRYEDETHRRGFDPPYYTAIALAGLGRHDDALSAIERLDPAVSSNGWLILVDPSLDRIRHTDRFNAVLHRIGLQPLAAPVRI